MVQEAETQDALRPRGNHPLGAVAGTSATDPATTAKAQGGIRLSGTQIALANREDDHSGVRAFEDSHLPVISGGRRLGIILV